MPITSEQEEELRGYLYRPEGSTAQVPLTLRDPWRDISWVELEKWIVREREKIEEKNLELQRRARRIERLLHIVREIDYFGSL